MKKTRSTAAVLFIVAAFVTTTESSAIQSEDTFLKDVGPHICETVRLGMQTTEPDWYEKLPRGYHWWPHWFRQRVAADDAEESFGVAVSKINIESTLLQGIPVDDSTLERLATLNLSATTSSLILIPESNQLVSYSNVYAHEQNQRVSSGLALISVANQAAESAAITDDLQRILGGELARSIPPAGAMRSVPDDMLNIADRDWIPAGQRPSVYVGDECTRAKREAGRMSLLTNASETGLTAEFLWEEGSEPTLVKLARGDNDVRTETVMLRMHSDYRHPRLGNGMQVILALPFDVPDKVGPRVANQLNLAERAVQAHTHQLGAWAYLPASKSKDVLIPFANNLVEANGNAGTLVHIAFLPNGVYFPGIASVMFQSSAMRSKWVKGWIDKHTDLRVESDPD